MTSFDGVTRLYDSLAASEWKRLDSLPMERELTLKTIKHYVPRGRIVDIGGGPGKIALALKDHEVTLYDLSTACVELAKKQGLNATVANALDLQLEPEYDGVLLLGPLYHLMEESERVQAVKNAIRGAKPGGYIFCAMVTIEAHLRDIAVRDPGRLKTQPEFYKKYVKDGRYERPGVQSWHTKAVQVRPFFERFGQVVKIMPAEGIFCGGLDKNLGPEWADLMHDFVGEEHIGCADHVLVVLKKVE